MNKDIEEIVENLFLKLKELPSGFEISTSQLIGKDSLKNFSDKELFDIHYKLIEKCKNENVKLNFDRYSGAIVGLPFVVQFIKE